MLALGWLLGLGEALCDAGAGCPDRPDLLLGLLVYGGLALVLTAFDAERPLALALVALARRELTGGSAIRTRS